MAKKWPEILIDTLGVTENLSEILGSSIPDPVPQPFPLQLWMVEVWGEFAAAPLISCILKMYFHPPFCSY